MWTTVYDLRNDAQRIALLQAASLQDGPAGLSPRPALVGTSEWWRAVSEGVLDASEVEGLLVDVRQGRVGDWPELVVRAADGAEHHVVAHGDERAYRPGRPVRVHVVLHPFKPPAHLTPVGALSRLVVRVEQQLAQ